MEYYVQEMDDCGPPPSKPFFNHTNGIPTYYSNEEACEALEDRLIRTSHVLGYMSTATYGILVVWYTRRIMLQWKQRRQQQQQQQQQREEGEAARSFTIVADGGIKVSIIGAVLLLHLFEELLYHVFNWGEKWQKVQSYLSVLRTCLLALLVLVICVGWTRSTRVRIVTFAILRVLIRGGEVWIYDHDDPELLYRKGPTLGARRTSLLANLWDIVLVIWSLLSLSRRLDGRGDVHQQQETTNDATRSRLKTFAILWILFVVAQVTARLGHHHAWLKQKVQNKMLWNLDGSAGARLLIWIIVNQLSWFLLIVGLAILWPPKSSLHNNMSTLGNYANVGLADEVTEYTEDWVSEQELTTVAANAESKEEAEHGPSSKGTTT